MDQALVHNPRQFLMLTAVADSRFFPVRCSYVSRPHTFI